MSNLYTGNISDKQLTLESGLLDLLQKKILSWQKGFDGITPDLQSRGIGLHIPPFLRDKQQLDNEEVLKTRRIASLRIHVERCMGRIKNYHIFDGVMPLSMMDIANQMFFVCAVITNFNPPLCS